MYMFLSLMVRSVSFLLHLSWWLMKVGDLVISKQDVAAGFSNVFGLIITMKSVGRKQSYVIWNTVSAPVGWHYNDTLKVL